MPGNEHPFVREELMAWLDGELPPDRAADAAAHIERCHECESVAADLRLVSERMLVWQPEPARASFGASIMAELDAKPPRKRARAWPWLTAFGTAIAACIVLIAVTQPRAKKPAGTPAAFLSEPVSPSASFDIASPKPMIARTAEIRLVAADFNRTRASLEEILRQHHGWFSQVNLNAPPDAGRTLETVLRVPSDQLEAVLSDVRKLGRVESESQSGEDVTRQYTDLTARLLNARNSEQRLTELLRRAGKLSDVLAVEKEIESVRGEIERMQAEEKTLSTRVEFVSITVNVLEEYKARLQPANSTVTQFRNAAVEGSRAAAAEIVAVAVFLLSIAPSVLLWALVVVPLWFWWKKHRRSTP